MSYHASNLAAGFSSKPKGTRTYIDSEGNLVEEGNGEFLGARLAGGEAFVSDDEEASSPEYYSSSSSGHGHKEKKKSKSKKHRKEAAFDPSMHASSAVMGQREYALGGHEATSSKKKRSKDAVPRTAGGCCGGCQHAQQPAPQQLHQHYAQHPGMPAGHVQGNYGYPGGPAPQGYGGRSYH